MIHMRMRHQNMANRFSAHRVQYRREMRFVVGPRINDRNTLTAHDKCVGPLERERPGIIAGYPSDKRRKLRRRFQRWFKIPIKRDVIHKTKVMVAPARQPT
jgi:hypothetical protein